MDKRTGNASQGSYGWETDLVAINRPVEAILIRHLLDLGPSFAATAAQLTASTKLSPHAVHSGLVCLAAAGGVIKLHPPASHADQTFIVFWLQKMRTCAQLSKSHPWVKTWLTEATATVMLKNDRRRAAIGVRTMLRKSASKKQRCVDLLVYCILTPGPYISHTSQTL